MCRNTNYCLDKYADDTTLLARINKMTIQEDLNMIKNEIINFQDWTVTNRMTINTAKSKLLFITKTSPHDILPLELLSIKSVETIKLLGVTFSKTMDFKLHFKDIIKRASQRLYYLRIMKSYCSTDELWLIYTMLIRSLLEYAAPMFIGLEKSIENDLELLQRRAHRIICGSVSSCECVVVSLYKRRCRLSNKLYSSIEKCDSHVLHRFLPKLGFRGRTIVPIFRTTKRSKRFFMHHCIANSGISINNDS